MRRGRDLLGYGGCRFFPVHLCPSGFGRLSPPPPADKMAQTPCPLVSHRFRPVGDTSRKSEGGRRERSPSPLPRALPVEVWIVTAFLSKVRPPDQQPQQPRVLPDMQILGPHPRISGSEICFRVGIPLLGGPAWLSRLLALPCPVAWRRWGLLRRWP